MTSFISVRLLLVRDVCLSASARSAESEPRSSGNRRSWMDEALPHGCGSDGGERSFTHVLSL